MNTPPLSPFMLGMLVGAEAKCRQLPILAPEDIRTNPEYLDLFNQGVPLGFRIATLI